MASINFFFVNSRIIKSLCVCVMTFTVGLSAFALTRAEWIDLFDTKSTPDYSEMEYALDVHAWTESYQLRGMLRMYLATGDTKYLGMFAKRANSLYTVFTDDKLIVAKYAEDLARQGYCEAVGEANSAQSGFYNFNTGWPTLYWTRNDTTDVKVEFGAGIGWGDNYALTIQSDTVNQNQAVYTFTPVANRNYIITFMCKAGDINGSSNANPPEVLVVKASDGTVLCQRSFYPGNYGLDKSDGWDDEIWSWNKESVWFTTDDNPYPVNVIFRLKDYTKANSKAVFDDVTVYYNGHNCMPLGWSRFSGVSASYVYRDTSVTPNISGTASVTINMPSGAAQGGAIFTPVNYNVNDNRNYEPLSEYYYEFYARIASGSGAQYSLADTTAGTNLISPTTITAGDSWTKITGKFSAPLAPDHVLEFRFFQTSGTAVKFHIDDLLIRRYAHYAVGDGMVALPLSEFYEMATKKMTPRSVSYEGANYDLDACASTCRSFVDGLISCHANELVTVSGSKKVYVLPDDGSLKHVTSGNTLPHNQYLALGIASAVMYRATGDTSYSDLANSLGLTFVDYLAYDTYCDSYKWYYDNPGILATDHWLYIATEDTGHANIDIDFVIEAMKSGLSCMPQSYMQKFANTFTINMWDHTNQYPRSTVWPDYGNDLCEYKTSSWIRMGEYDRDVYTLIKNKWDSEVNDLPWSSNMGPFVLNISEIIRQYDNQAAYWKFNETSGSTSYDASAGGYCSDGTLVGEPGRVQISGDNYAVEFDGSSQYIDCGTADEYPSLTINDKTDFTFTAKIKIPSVESYAQIMAIIPPIGLKVSFFLNCGHLRGLVYNTTTSASAIASAVLSTNTWYHVAMTYSGATSKQIKLYVNGNEVAYSQTVDGSGNVTEDYSGYPFAISFPTRGTMEKSFNGQIDEVRVFRQVLDQMTIYNIYSNNKY